MGNRTVHIGLTSSACEVCSVHCASVQHSYQELALTCDLSLLSQPAQRTVEEMNGNPKSVLCSRIAALLGLEAAESIAEYVSETFKASSSWLYSTVLSFLSGAAAGYFHRYFVATDQIEDCTSSFHQFPSTTFFCVR